MREIKMLSNERNMLIRILENYEQYIKSDKEITDDYKQLELHNLNIINQRVMGQIPKQEYEQKKYIDNSIFSSLMED